MIGDFPVGRAYADREKQEDGALVSGYLKIEGLDTITDHTSLYELLVRAIVDSGWSPREEVVENLHYCAELEEARRKESD